MRKNSTAPPIIATAAILKVMITSLEPGGLIDGFNPGVVWITICVGIWVGNMVAVGIIVGVGCTVGLTVGVIVDGAAETAVVGSGVVGLGVAVGPELVEGVGDFTGDTDGSVN